jgi:type I site-specific restriction endonuclease
MDTTKERTNEDMPHTSSTETRAIDDTLALARWTLRSGSSRTPTATGALAIRTRARDVARQEPYLLAVGGQVLGLVHVVPQSEGVIGFERQTRADELRLGGGLRGALPLLPYSYYSNGTTTTFTNWLEPVPRARRVSGFHRPETLVRWMAEADQLQRSRLRRIQTQPLPQGNALLLAALGMLDQSLSENRQRTLFALDEGMDRLGIVYACAQRMVRFGGTRSLLFLVSQWPQGAVARRGTTRGSHEEARAAASREARHRALLSAGARYSLEEAMVFVCDVGHMARCLAEKPDELPLEAFDTVFAYGLPDEEQQGAFRRILTYFDAVIVGFSRTSPHPDLVEVFNGNIYAPASAQLSHLRPTG